MAVLNKIKITEISSVDKPAQQHARALIMKRANPDAADGDTDAEVATAVAKAIDDGRLDGFKKYSFVDMIHLRAAEIRLEGETTEKAFARTITEDEAGRLLFKAMKAAPGSEVKPSGDAPQDYVKPSQPTHIGPAHAKLHSMAVDHQRAHAGQSYAGAYSYLYAHPDNAALRNQVRAEHLAATMARANG